MRSRIQNELAGKVGEVFNLVGEGGIDPDRVILDVLLRFFGGGRRRIRTFVGVSQQIYSLPSLTA